MTVDEINFGFEYQLKADPVKLSIIIGNGQVGGSALEFNGKPLGDPGAFTDFTVGTASALKGKKLIVRTLVADVNQKTNKTSVTYALTGGENHPPFRINHEVKEDGDGTRYTTTIAFIK